MLSSTDDEFKLQLTDDEDKQIASLLKNNFGLERLPSIEARRERWAPSDD
jgi:hypothetical protein